KAFKALGGVQIAAGSERIKVLDNVIFGGAGNGVTLGGSVQPDRPIGTGQTQQTIESIGDRIKGFLLQSDGTGLVGVTLSFTRKDGNVRTAISGSSGFFQTQAEPSQYSVSLLSPGFQIKTIAVSDEGEFGRFHRITVAPVETPAADNALAFLYEIQI